MSALSLNLKLIVSTFLVAQGMKFKNDHFLSSLILFGSNSFGFFQWYQELNEGKNS